MITPAPYAVATASALLCRERATHILRTLSRWFWRIVLQVFPRRLDPLICPACHSERLMSRATFTSKASGVRGWSASSLAVACPP
jgi:hypothetical protein